MTAQLGSNGSLLLSNGTAFQNTGGVTIGSTNGLIINGTGNTWNFQATTTIAGAVTGSGSLLFTNGFNPVVNFTGDLSGFHGTLSLTSAGSSAFDFSNTTTFSNDANWTLNETAPTSAANSFAYFSYAGTGSKTIILGSLSGAVTPGTGSGVGYFGFGVLNNNISGTTATYQIGGANTSTTFAGAIQNGAGTSALTKVGTGNFTLSGVDTHTDATSVTGGTLTLTDTKTLGSTNGIMVGSASTLSLAAVSALNTPGATTGTTAGSPVSVSGQVPVSLGGGTLRHWPGREPRFAVRHDGHGRHRDADSDGRFGARLWHDGGGHVQLQQFLGRQ